MKASATWAFLRCFSINYTVSISRFSFLFARGKILFRYLAPIVIIRSRIKFYALCGSLRKSSGFTDTRQQLAEHVTISASKLKLTYARHRNAHASGIGVNFQDPVFWILRPHFIYDTSEFIARTLAREICAFPIPNSGGSYGKIICPWQSNTFEFCGWARHKARIRVPTANYNDFDDYAHLLPSSAENTEYFCLTYL